MLTIEKVIAQLFIMGFQGTEINDESEVVRDIKKHKIGGVILFNKQNDMPSEKRNIDTPRQLQALTQQLRSYQKDLFIYVDQEGGAVARLSVDCGFPEFPAPFDLGRRNDVHYTKQVAQAMAILLSTHGIHANFFPTVDLALQADNPIIAKLNRSFSASPDCVIKHAEIFLDVFKENKIVSCLKHFPGHGSALADSHEGFVDITNLWDPCELQPYQYFFKLKKGDMVMIAHVFHRDWDEKLPASLSKNIVTDLLRTKMGFQGVAVIDDMHMKAISAHFDPEEAILLAINAGNDLLIYGNNIGAFQENLAEKCIQITKRLVSKKFVSEERIWQAYQRILAMKASLKP